jgi:hypothetical protein
VGGYQVLFSLEVVHGYFSDPARCRLRFEPDEATGAWLKRSGCVLRRRANGLTVYFTRPDGARGRGLQVGEAVTLAFNASPLDPAFGLYSDGLAPCEVLEPGSAPTLVFDSARASLADPNLNIWSVTAPATIGDGGLNVRPDFQAVIRPVLDPAEKPRTYQINFASRTMIWKYLLIGKWADLRPLVIDTAALNPVQFEDPFADGLDSLPRQEPLADGRMAIGVKSTTPIALADRPKGSIRLVTRSESGSRGPVLSSLPCAAPANFAYERPGDPSTLVAEIYVPR